MTDQLVIKYAGGTDRGRVREQNEDCILMSEFAHSDVLLLQVADGVGGHEGGEIASKLTVDYVQASVAKAVLLANSGAGYVPGWLEKTVLQAITDANIQLIEQQDLRENLDDMATTLVVMLVHNGEIAIGHLGDSRCYQLEQQQLQQITEDHTALQKLLNEGKINKQEFDTLPMHNIISQAVGLIKKPEISIKRLPFNKQSCYILCSDGLTNCMSDAQIQHVLEKNESLERLVDELITRANDNGGTDNISVVLMKSE